MYNHYYSSSDVQLYLSSYDHTKVIKVDTALSLGYSLRQTSAPIYSLGSREAQFFSVGNTIGNGTLTIAFTDEEYLKYCLSYIDNSKSTLIYQTELQAESSGIVSNIKEAASSAKDGSVLYQSKKFGMNNATFAAAAKNADATFSTISNEERNISIGAIRNLFNIKMFINNETALRTSDSKVITLKGVKILGENFNATSTADAPLMLSYNFMFKDIQRG
jgi:hypothetical protein